MNTPSVSIARLLRDLDGLKTAAQALPAHYAMRCDAHVRERYAGLLATVLLTQGAVTEEQSRLFRLLLASLDLADAQARLFEQAPETGPDVLGECARLFGEHGLVSGFLVDAAVLLRLAGPLPAGQQQLLCELADLFNLPPADLALVADLSAIVLGMEPAQDIPPLFDYAAVQVWEEFLYRPLTAERLAAGPLGGRWKVITPLKLDTGWKLEGARLRFEGEGHVLTEMAKKGYVQITDGYLENPLMKFTGNFSIEIADTEIHGEYPENAKCTAISIIPGERANKNAGYEGGVQLSGLKVSTRNARAFLIKETSRKLNFEVNNCCFRYCGNRYLNGGAIAAYAKENRIASDRYMPFIWCGEGKRGELDVMIHGSEFKHCHARLGGGVFYSGTINENGVRDSVFEDCTPLAYHSPGNVEDFAFGGGAMFLRSVNPGLSTPCIENCSFKNTSLQVGYSHEFISGANAVYGCKFENSFLAYTGGNCTPGSNCSFSNKQKNFSNPVKIEKEKQSWWYEYQ